MPRTIRCEPDQDGRRNSKDIRGISLPLLQEKDRGPNGKQSHNQEQGQFGVENGIPSVEGEALSVDEPQQEPSAQGGHGAEAEEPIHAGQGPEFPARHGVPIRMFSANKEPQSRMKERKWM